MRKIILLVTLFSFVVIANAQKKDQNKKDENKKDENKYVKLFDMYTMEKYEKCIDAAEGYTQSEKSAKDAEPYLYLAMSYFEISKDPERFDLKKNPNLKEPLRKALSNTGKFVKRDKDGSVRAEHSEYMEELKEAGADAIKAMYERKETAKYTAYARDMAKAFDKDNATYLYTGIYLVLGNSQSDGLKNIDLGIEGLKKSGKPAEGFDRVSKKMLIDGFVQYTDFLSTQKDKSKLKPTIALAQELLPESEEIKAQAKKIN